MLLFCSYSFKMSKNIVVLFIFTIKTPPNSDAKVRLIIIKDFMDNKNRVIKAYLKKVQAEDLIELKGLIKIEIGIGSEKR